MSKNQIVVFALTLALSGSVVQAEDLTGSAQFLCAPVQATMCVEDGECVVDMPWNFNIPEFVEVDLGAGRLATTEASGEDRATPIEHLRREDGKIVFHGFEMERAFSWVIDEQSGRTSVAIAGDGVAMAIFGTCTPIAGDGKE